MKSPVRTRSHIQELLFRQAATRKALLVLLIHELAAQESEDLDDFVSAQWLKDNSLCFFTLLDRQASVTSVAALSTWASLANSNVIVFVLSADILEVSDELRELATTR